MKRVCFLLILSFLIGLYNNHLNAENISSSELIYLGNNTLYLSPYFDFYNVITSIIGEDKKSSAKPFKPKKDIEIILLTEINKNLKEYNLESGDLFLKYFKIEGNVISALVLINLDKEPTIRYYYITSKGNQINNNQ
jgi:hypothetical protein